MEYKKEKIEVTDEVLNVAQNAFRIDNNGHHNPYRGSMKAALEAVFENINYKEKRPDFEHCTQGLDSDGWLVHDGGDCPVDYDTVVIVEYRDGVRTAPAIAKEIPWISYHPSCIPIRYRIIKQKPEKEECVCKHPKVGGFIPVNNIKDKLCAYCNEKIILLKVYKLSEMYKCWFIMKSGTIHTNEWLFPSLARAKDNFYPSNYGELIAITRADATEFFAGQGL